MNSKMIKSTLFLFGCITVLSLLSFSANDETDQYSITVKVVQLQNSKGIVQFSLYNKDGTIPDEHFEKYFRQMKGSVTNQTSEITFRNLPKGVYAINILHDENEDGIVDKGFVLPIEGLGFSNFETLNLFNRPSFDRAKFELKSDTTITIQTIYM